MPIYLREDSQELNKQQYHLSKNGKDSLNALIAQMEAFGLEDHDGYKMLKHLRDEDYNQVKKKDDGKKVKDPNIHTAADKVEDKDQGIKNKTVEGGIHRNKVSKDKVMHKFTDWVYGRNGELTLKHKNTQNRLNHTADVPKKPKLPKMPEIKVQKPIKVKNGQIHVQNLNK